MGLLAWLEWINVFMIDSTTSTVSSMLLDRGTRRRKVKGKHVDQLVSVDLIVYMFVLFALWPLSFSLSSILWEKELRRVVHTFFLLLLLNNVFGYMIRQIHQNKMNEIDTPTYYLHWPNTTNYKIVPPSDLLHTIILDHYTFYTLYIKYYVVVVVYVSTMYDIL